MLTQVGGRGGVAGHEFLAGRSGLRQLGNQVSDCRAALGGEHDQPVTHRGIDLDRGVRHAISIPSVYRRTRAVAMRGLMELEDLYVCPVARRHGLATQLINDSAAWARMRGFQVLDVVIATHGTEVDHLIGYYRDRGFVDEGRHLLSRRL